MSIYDIPEDEVLQFWSWEIFPDADLGTYIYVIQEGEDGPIKIGVSNDPSRRLQELQTGNALDLRLLVKRPGIRKDEVRLHHLLATHRMKGEWFEFCLPVQAVIEELK